MLFATLAMTTLSISVHAQAPTVDAAAIKIMQQMTDYLGGLEQYSVHSQNTLEHVTDSGQRIDEDISVSMSLSRPDKLQVVL